MYCPNCGKQIDEKAEICVNCGINIQRFLNNSVPLENKPNWIVNSVSLCCFPLLGFVLFFVWRTKNPRGAKYALLFSILGFFVSVIIGIIFGLLDAFITIMDDDSYYY